MSNEEKQTQETHYKSINRGIIRVSLMQLVTIGSVIFAILSWYQNRAEKQIIDGTVLATQITDLRKDLKSFHSADSLRNLQTHIRDSLSEVNKFIELKKNISSDMDRRFITTEKRLERLEYRVKTSFVEEIKKHGPNGPVTIVPKNN